MRYGLGIILAVTLLARAAWAADAGAGGHLLLDDRLIAETENVSLRVGCVEKHPANPLFGEDKPWEPRMDNMYANVLFDEEEQIFKCWYSAFVVDSAHSRTPLEQRRKTTYNAKRAEQQKQKIYAREMGLCYATSKDGVHWEKPCLGLTEFEGSTDNNIVRRPCYESGLAKDLREPDPKRRYKAFLREGLVAVSFSADGVHWTKPVRRPGIKAVGDTHNNWFWDERSKKYVGITRLHADHQRIVGRTESRDFVQWTEAVEVLRGPERHLQAYAMPSFAYANVYLGLVALINTRTDTVQCELAWSPDTVQWKFVDFGRPLIPLGLDGTCDDGCIYAAAFPIVRNDKILIYYGGCDDTHYGWRKGHLCLATLRLDGFAGYEPIDAAKPGRVDTVALPCTGAGLWITADVEKSGSVAVLRLGDDHQVPGTSAPVRTATTRGKVDWARGEDLSGVVGKKIRLRFILDRAKLYAFGFMQERNGCAKRRMAIGLASWPLDRFVGYAAEDEPEHVTTKPFRLAAKSLDLNLDARESIASGDKWEKTEGWYTLAHDAMRSGRTHFSAGAPFTKMWHRKFFEEFISTENEPIVAEDLVFIGTWNGTFFALNAYTGEDEWKVDVPGGVRHAACYDGGNVYFANIGDRSGASVFCCEAKIGKKMWEYKTGKRGGFATSPCLYRGKVYIGSRRGILYCLDATTGKKIWTYATESGAPYLQTCAARDNRVMVAAEDMVPKCFDAETGEVIWKAERMKGDTCRWYYPVFWKDAVVFRSCFGHDAINGTQSLVENATKDGKRYREARKKFGWSKEAAEMIGDLPGSYTPEKYRQEQEFVREQIRTGKAAKSFYLLNVADGKEKIVTSVTYAGSENGYSTPTPSPVDFDGNLYVLFKSVYSRFTYPIRQFDCIGRLNGETGIPTMLENANGGERSDFPITSDEANHFTVGGDKLYDTHDHVFSYYDFKAKHTTKAFSSHAPEQWGGVFLVFAEKRTVQSPSLETPDAHLKVNNEWNGTACGSVAIYKDYVWWRTGNMIVCLKGKGDAQ